MAEVFIRLAELLSETSNQVALLCFCLMLMLAFIITMLMRLLGSLFDLKRSMYEAEVLPDRSKKGERY